MPAASSIYWNSLDSQRSSGESSGEGFSANRHYVDPWDLENYVYLRRHSVVAPIYQQTRSCVGGYSRLSHRAQTEPDYWYSPSIREPGYDAPASVEELYFGVQKQIAHNYYPQPIYEDNVSHYTTAYSIYSPLSEIHHSEPFDVYKTNEKLRRRKKVQRTWNYRREECLYHGVIDEDYQYHETPLCSKTSRQQDKRYANATPSSHQELNTYGHLKIDYTNSWDSLHRKISK